MAASIFLAFFFLFTIHVHIFSSFATSSKGFNMKLISKYSKHSPMNLGNVTDLERYSLMLQLSQKRSSRLMERSSNSTLHPNIISPKISFVLDALYIIETLIGEKMQRHFLDFDTGSDMTWVQCEGCNPCFKLNPDPFFHSQSNTYEVVECDDIFCFPKKCDEQDQCLYDIEYNDGSNSEGVLATESFHFPSTDNPQGETIEDYVFGCGLENRVTWGLNSGDNNVVAGILGIGVGMHSFISQVAEANYKFGYCLATWDSRNPHTLLRFGAQADSFNTHSSTKITTPIFISGQDAQYYVHLLDISVDGKRLGSHPGTFPLDPGSGGGVFFDTGTPITYLANDLYNLLEAEMRRRLAHLNLQPYDASNNGILSGLKFCFVKPPGLIPKKHLPWITFHLEGGDFEPIQGGIYAFFDNFFCLQIQPSDGSDTILGAFLQANHYFVHDFAQKTLSIAWADCGRNV